MDATPIPGRQPLGEAKISSRFADGSRGARSWTELPAQAVKYVRTIEELIECPVTLLSTSPERDDTILMRDPFED